MSSDTSQVTFVGAGPGAADLITLRGLKALQNAQVVLADALIDPALRGFAPQALWLEVGKRGYDSAATPQAKINALLVQAAQAHARVVRLKGGDPSVFGRLEEEIEALAQVGIGFEVVPGITAALAAAAQTGRPLTRRGRGRSLALSTAATAQGETVATRSADTEVFYMAGRKLPALQTQLLAAGWPAQTPVQVVSRAGWPDALASEHCVHSLAAASALHAGRPAVVVVGVGACALPLAADAAAAKARPAASGRGAARPKAAKAAA